jgi:hypothetical protein
VAEAHVYDGVRTPLGISPHSRTSLPGAPAAGYRRSVSGLGKDHRSCFIWEDGMRLEEQALEVADTSRRCLSATEGSLRAISDDRQAATCPPQVSTIQATRDRRDRPSRGRVI